MESYLSISYKGYGAAEGNRTPTLSPETDFESVASTSSATAAQLQGLRTIIPRFQNYNKNYNSVRNGHTTGSGGLRNSVIWSRSENKLVSLTALAHYVYGAGYDL